MQGDPFSHRLASTIERQVEADDGPHLLAAISPGGARSTEVTHPMEQHMVKASVDAHCTKDALVVEIAREKRQRTRKQAEDRYVLDWIDAERARTSPDTTAEAAELSAFYMKVLGTFRPMTQLAFVMVRELDMSGEDVARHLGISESVVRWYISTVQRRFRWALLEIGVRPPAPPRRTMSTKAVVRNDPLSRNVGDTAAVEREVA